MNNFSEWLIYNLKYFFTLIITVNISISDFFLIYYILFSFCFINFLQIKFCKKLYNEVKIEIILLPKLTYLIPGIYRIYMYILGIFILIILKKYILFFCYYSKVIKLENIRKIYYEKVTYKDYPVLFFPTDLLKKFFSFFWYIMKLY